MSPVMYIRFLGNRVEEALLDTPVVLIVGPRRAGKTTLARMIGDESRTYLTLDDQTVLDAARNDPIGFVRGLGQATIDEVQRVPELLLAIKKSVDEDYQPGRFLLTGSANVMTLPMVADSLAGRIETLRLLPLARAEMVGGETGLLQQLFAARIMEAEDVILGDDLVRLVMAGGFPEALARNSERRRQVWARSWMSSVLIRDLQDIAAIERLTELPSFFRLLAGHSGQLANYSRLGSGIGVSYKTGQRYVGLLEKMFLVSTLPPWHTNALKRVVRTPKLHFLDSGLLAAVQGLTFAKIMADRSRFVALLESFVFSEVLKLMPASDMRLTPFHFRDQQMHEVDIVLERDDGMIAGIEIKASATVRSGDLAGLRSLASACGERFAYGIVLHDSDRIVPFTDRLAAVPLSCLWNSTGSSEPCQGPVKTPA